MERFSFAGDMCEVLQNRMQGRSISGGRVRAIFRGKRTAFVVTIRTFVRGLKHSSRFCEA